VKERVTDMPSYAFDAFACLYIYAFEDYTFFINLANSTFDYYTFMVGPIYFIRSKVPLLHILAVTVSLTRSF